MTTAFLIPALIITEATLGYLGWACRPGTDSREFFVTSWDRCCEGQPALNSQPWLLAVPALCLAVVVLAFNYLGDGLRMRSIRGWRVLSSGRQGNGETSRQGGRAGALFPFCALKTGGAYAAQSNSDGFLIGSE